MTPKLRVGALYGQIKDTSHSDRDAKGGSVGAYYDLSKRTTLLAMWDILSNDTNARLPPLGIGWCEPELQWQ